MSPQEVIKAQLLLEAGLNSTSRPEKALDPALLERALDLASARILYMLKDVSFGMRRIPHESGFYEIWDRTGDCVVIETEARENE